MPATQISFLAFAQAAQQQATVCTPPVTQAPAALVVQPDVADGGECTVAELWDAACAICEFHVSAHRPVTDSYMFLMNQFYARGGFTESPRVLRRLNTLRGLSHEED